MLPGNEREDVEKGGKIIMPPSALDALTRLNIVYPMLFKLTNKKDDRVTHCGVLEFVADEGRVYLPYWMMRNLLLEEGGFLTVDSISLPVATYSKFQPQHPDFLDIANPKAVLENSLRSHACLTQGDIIAITYNNRIYEICVLEVKPGNAVSIIECDMNVEFAAPVGYQERTVAEKHETEQDKETEEPMDMSQYVDPNKFQVFSGAGNRLDGKAKSESQSAPLPHQPTERKRGIPNYDYKIGKITFIRTSNKTKALDNDEDEEKTFEAFSGEGQSLRKGKSRK